MLKREIKTYSALNELAEKNGTVIFGAGEDKEIPLGELKQAFAFEEKLYNRSFRRLSVSNAAEAYDSCIAPLTPETVFLHLGGADTERFEKDPAAFDQAYIALIKHIKATDKTCRVVVVSQKNRDNLQTVAEMNKHLKYIADSEKCNFFDIAGKRVWNPKETKEVISFVYSVGFVRPLNRRRPLFDLVKILFCFEP